MRRLAIILCPLTLVLSSVIASQDGGENEGKLSDIHLDSFEDMCKKVKCVPPSTLHIKLNDGTAIDAPAPAHPTVYEGEIWIFIGETVYVEAKAKRRKLVNLRPVGRVTDPSRTLVIESFQKDVGASGPQTFIAVHNPYSRYLRYSARISRLGHSFSHTTACPVPPENMSIETWPEPVGEFVLSAFELFKPKKGASLDCR